MATIKDIAREAGVSHGTVSNVLNKTGKVSAEKIQLVEAAAKRLGYKINVQAKELRKGSSKRICLILPTIQIRAYLDLYDQIQEIFSLSGYEILLYTTNRIPLSEKKVWDKVMSLRPDAVICFTCLEQIPDLDTAEFPVVFIDYVCPMEGSNLFYASFDFAKAAKEIACYIAKKHYRRIALFATSGKSACKTIFCSTLTEYISPSVKLVPFSSDDKLMFHKSFEIISSEEAYDLVITFHPEQAECILQAAACTDASALPDIISLSSSSTIPDSRFLSYELNYRYMGRCMAEGLLEVFGSQSQKLSDFHLQNDGFRYHFSNLSRSLADTSINILTLESPAANALKLLLPDFKKRTGITASLTILSFDELYDTINTMGGSGYYDLIRSDVAWLSHLAEKTYLPLEETGLDVAGLLSSLIPETEDSFSRVNNVLYTLPFDPSIQMMFYRSDLFEDAMVRRQYYEQFREELTVPRDFKEYNQVASFFTKRINPSSPVSYGSTLTFGSAGVAACDFLPRIQSSQSVFSKEGILTVNTPPILEAMEQYVKTYEYTDRSINKWWKQSVENFSKGDTAMTITFSNHASYLINSKHSNVVDRLGFSMIPGNRPLLGGGVLGISRASRHVSASCEFIKWVYSDEISTMLTILGGTSANQSIYTNGKITSLFPWLETAKASFRLGTRRAQSTRYPCLNEKTLENILGAAVRSSVTGIMNPKEALNQAQEIISHTFQPSGMQT